MNLGLIDWGSVPEWLAAIGTVGAVIVALVIAFRDSRQRARAERSAQADNITAWQSVVGRGTFNERAHINLSNSSSLPIYDIALSYGAPYGEGARFQTGASKQIFLLRLPPGKCQVRELPKVPKLDKPQYELGISISFRDSYGRFWRRDASGVLTETRNHPFDELKVNKTVRKWASYYPIK